MPGERAKGSFSSKLFNSTPGLQIIPEIRASNPETLQNLSKKLHMKPGP